MLGNFTNAIFTTGQHTSYFALIFFDDRLEIVSRWNLIHFQVAFLKARVQCVHEEVGVAFDIELMFAGNLEFLSSL